MDMKEFLYKIYKRRKALLAVFTVFASIPILLFAVLIVVFVMQAATEGATQNDFLQLFGFAVFAAGYAWAILGRFCGSIRHGLKEAKQKIDYMYDCLMKLDLVQRDTIKSECEKFFGGFLPKAKIDFGEDCLYGKIAWANYKVTSYHVIMPYANIKQVILPEFFKDEFKEKFADIAEATINIASAASVLAGASGIFTTASHHVPFVIVDAAGNHHFMSCGPHSNLTKMEILGYVEKILERSPHVQTGYISE